MDLYNISILGSRRPTRRPRVFENRQKVFEKYDDDTFIQRFRISKESVRNILAKIKDKIRNHTERFVEICITNICVILIQFVSQKSSS